MNKVILIGNLAKDPELKTTTTGISVCTLTLAVNRDYINEDGERECDFFPIKVWRERAENCVKYLSKGSKIAVAGQLQNRSYEDMDGIVRYITEIKADQIEFLSFKKQEDTEAAAAAPAKKITPDSEGFVPPPEKKSTTSAKKKVATAKAEKASK